MPPWASKAKHSFTNRKARIKHEFFKNNGLQNAEIFTVNSHNIKSFLRTLYFN